MTARGEARTTACTRPLIVREHGFTLIELMVATALGVLIIAAMTSLFTDVSQTNREMAKTTSMIENARYAMQELREDVIHAGFWGRYVPEFDNQALAGFPTDVPNQVPDPCLAYADWSVTPGYVDSLLGIPLQVHDAIPGTCGALLTDRVPGTDVLVVRHAEPCLPGIGNCEAESSTRLYFQAAMCQAQVDAGNSFQLDASTFPLLEMDCATVAQKRRFIQNIYYIRSWALDPAENVPTLVRSRFGVSGGVPAQLGPEPLVQGIERFHVEVGIDDVSDAGLAVDPNNPVQWADPTNRTSPENRGDGIADGAFVSCSGGGPCTVDQLINVVAVRIHLLARASAESPGYIDSKSYQLGSLSVAPINDSFKRHVFANTMRLHNVAGRRETP